MEKTRTIEIQGKLARASCLPNGRRAHAHRLVEAEAGGALRGRWRGRVRDAPPVQWGPPGWRDPENAAEPREHGEAAVLELLDLQLLEVTGLGEAEGVEAATGGHVTDGELVEGGVGEAGAVRPGEADEDDLDGEDGPEGGVAGALGGEGRDGAGELVRDRGAVVGGCTGARGEPRMSVPLSAAQAPVTPSIAQRPWITSRSAFFSEPKDDGDSPPPG